MELMGDAVEKPLLLEEYFHVCPLTHSLPPTQSALFLSPPLTLHPGKGESLKEGVVRRWVGAHALDRQGFARLRPVEGNLHAS